jgi:hypothetical protein
MGLFHGQWLKEELDSLLGAALRKVDKWDRDDFLAQNEDLLIEHVTAGHQRKPVELWWDKAWRTDPEEVRIEGYDEWLKRPYVVMGTRFEISVPGDGDLRLMTCRPSRYPSIPVAGDVRGNELVITIKDADLTPEKVMNRFAGARNEVERFLEYLNRDIEAYNKELRQQVTKRVKDRRARLLAERELAASLPFPVRPVTGRPTYPVAVKPKRLPVRTSTKPFEPEPALEAQYYEEILRQCSGWARSIERTPGLPAKLDEEALRDLLLGALNTNWEGQASGEVFNGSGKTDILIRQGDRNVFIAECKFWKGQAGIKKALNQLLGYLVWRDSKAALIVFIKQRDVTSVLEKLHEAVSEHEQCLRAVEPAQDPEKRRDYIFHANDDEKRTIRLAVLPVVLPPAQGG